MNLWIERSIEISNAPGYLDSLLNIYPAPSGSPRQISKTTEEEIRKLFQEGDLKKLLYELLKLPKFPLEDPYIPCLRRFPELLEKNPETEKRICARLLTLDIEDLLNLVKQPKRPSRQMGNAFKNWLRSLGYPFVEEEEFCKREAVMFLEGGDRKLKEFTTQLLAITELKRGVDFILKIGKKLLIGEAKFITDFGGSQTNQLREALDVATLKGDNYMGIAVLDGIVWLGDNPYLKQIKQIDGIALSALLLEDFINWQSSLFF